MREQRKTAIYSRKSKFTGKGESIENQIELCRKYIRVNSGEGVAKQVLVYEDEGFSGGNLERPQFKRMMADAKADGSVWEYFHGRGVDLFAEEGQFDGERGVMGYNRTEQKQGKDQSAASHGGLDHRTGGT